MNARYSPGRILGNHTENQGADLFADTPPSPYLTDSGDPRPIQTKPRAMPVHDGSRSDQDERFGPPGPARSQRNPEQFVQGSQSTARLLRVQSQQLPTESQVPEDEVLPGTENADQPTEEMSKRHDHGKNFSGKIRIQLFAKSFCRCTMFWRGTRPPNALPHITFEHLSEVVSSHHANKIRPKPCATRLEENVWIPNAWKNLPKSDWRWTRPPTRPGGPMRKENGGVPHC